MANAKQGAILKDDLVIKDKRYQITQMSAKTGSFLLSRLMDSLRQVMADATETETKEQQELTPAEREAMTMAAAKAGIEYMLMKLDEKMFEIVQRHALSVCGQFGALGEQEVVLPVIKFDGSFAIPELAFDTTTVMGLTSQSLYLNLSPFFLESGSKAS